MNEKYFSISGMCYRYGNEFLEPKMKVKLVKEPDNEHCHQCKDRELLMNDGLSAKEIIGLFNTNASIEEIQRVVEFV